MKPFFIRSTCGVNNLHPNYIAGLIDGEGSFNITISKDDSRSAGHRVVCEMHVTQKTHSASVLYLLKEFFGCGVVKIDNKNTDGLKDQLSSIVDISRVLIPHLDKYPLLTSKYLNYLTFKKAIKMLENKEHLTLQGIEKLKNMASQMNTNRTFEEKGQFCQEHTSKSTISPEWIQGFTDAEGCFYFYMGKPNIKGKESSTWYLQASLEIAQNTHDVAVLELIQSFFGCGIIKPKRTNNELKTAQSVRSVSRYVVSNLSDVMNVIIPFFDAHPLFTSKSLDYEDWKTIIQMKVSKEHFTEAGIQKMFQIKSQMKRGRKDFSRSS
jgi:hypothetical protein